MRITENDLFDKEVQAVHFDRFNKRLCIYIPKLNCWYPITMLVNSFLKHEQAEQKEHFANTSKKMDDRMIGCTTLDIPESYKKGK